ncbi:MAG: GAF domain-containing protein, partial [Sulfuricella sp.]
MNESLRVLLLEDSPTDAELNERVLRKAGIVFTALRVESQEGFFAALDDFKPDIILADYHLPGFDGLNALAIAHEKHPEIPFIFVTGAMGEERAVDSIRHGATDYIIKDRLARLPSAVQRALEEKTLRIRHRESEERYHQLFENMGSGVAIFEPDDTCQNFIFKTINRAAERIDQLRREEVIGHSVNEIFPGVRDLGFMEVFERVCRSGVAEHFSNNHYQDDRISGWRENYVYRLESGELVAVYDDVSERIERETRIKNLNRVLRTISACNEDLVRAASEDDLLTAVCRNIVQIGGHLLAWVVYPGKHPENQPVVVAHFGNENVFQSHAQLEHDPEHARDCLTVTAMRERRTASRNRLLDMPEHSFDKLQQLGVNSILALPLLNDGDLYGVITVFSATPDAFDADEMRLMEELAADLAYGIEALRTTGERDHYITQLSHAMKNTVTAIARTLEMRDPYTAGHQQRVTALCVSIARA